MAEVVGDVALRALTNLLVSFVNEHCDPVPDWKPLPNLMGVISQFDNAITVTRKFKAERDALREALAEIIAAHDANSGAEPSVSAFEIAIDAARALTESGGMALA